MTLAAREPAHIDHLNARVWHADAWSAATPLRRHLDTHAARRHALDALAVERLQDARVTPGHARGPRLDGGVYRDDGTRVDTARLRRAGTPCDDAAAEGCDLAAQGARVGGRQLYIGWALPHFGHALLESTARLWPLLEGDTPFYDGFVAHHDSTKHTWPQVLSTALRAVGGDPARVTVAKTPLVVDELDVPTPAFEFDAAAHPALARVLRAVQNTLADQPDAKHAPEAIYISRSGLSPDHRLAANEAQAEAIATGLGFHVFRPEAHTFAEQVRFMRRARWIMGCAGTGLHNAAFAPAAARVIVLCQHDNAPGCLNQLVLDQTCGHATDVVFCDEALGYADEGHGRHPWWLSIARLRTVLGVILDRPVGPPPLPDQTAWGRYLTARAAYLARAGRLHEARETLAEAASGAAGWSDDLRRRDASCALAQGAPAEAERRLADRAESDEQERELAAMRARAALDLGRPRDALRILADLSDGGDLSPTQKAWYAEALEATGDHANALAAWRAAAASAPDQPRPCFRASVAADRIGDTTAALTHVEEAIALHPANANMHVHRARLLMKLDRPCDAAAAFARAHTYGAEEAAITGEWTRAQARCPSPADPDRG